MKISVSEIKVGDEILDIHLQGESGKVTEVTPAWYGVAISYMYQGHQCVSAVFADRYPEGIEVERV